MIDRLTPPPPCVLLKGNREAIGSEGLRQTEFKGSGRTEGLVASLSSPGLMGNVPPCLFEVQHHAGRVLQVLLPQVGEAAHGGAIDDAMIRRPADIHDVSSDHLTVGVEAREDLTETQRDQVNRSRMD